MTLGQEAKRCEHFRNVRDRYATNYRHTCSTNQFQTFCFNYSYTDYASVDFVMTPAILAKLKILIWLIDWSLSRVSVPGSGTDCYVLLLCICCLLVFHVYLFFRYHVLHILCCAILYRHLTVWIKMFISPPQFLTSNTLHCRRRSPQRADSTRSLIRRNFSRRAKADGINASSYFWTHNGSLPACNTEPHTAQIRLQAMTQRKTQNDRQWEEDRATRRRSVVFIDQNENYKCYVAIMLSDE